MEAFYGGQPTKKVVWNWGVCDCRQLSVIDVEKLASLPSRNSDLRKGGKTAMVAPKDLSFGISRMFQTFGDMKGLPFAVEVFHNIGDAMQWLAEPDVKE
jgi:hypothetical protein